MQVIPAIDIIEGKCVRLTQGDYSTKSVFNENPLEEAAKFVNDGATLIHIVDLDGAKAGKIVNKDVIKTLCENNLPIEVGGGIRSDNDIAELLNIGVNRVILGSIAVTNPDFLKDAIKKYGKDKIVLGLDCKNDYVAIHGWQKNSEIKCIDMLNTFKDFGGENVIYTDISKDGMMSGTNLTVLKELTATNLKIVASGGISSIDDIIECKKIGCSGVIIGKAYYLRKINIKEAITYAN